MQQNKIYNISQEDVNRIIDDFKKKLSYEKSDDSKVGFKNRAKEGFFIGSTPPYGYIVENGKLFVKNDYTPDIVKRIFKEYISGKGFDGIARGLYNDNIPTPRNKGCKWVGSSVRTILENPHYTGDLVQSRTETLHPASKERVVNDESDFIIVENCHEGIISKEDFNLVKSLINQRKRKRPSIQKHIFSNIIYCKDCGKSMHYKKSLDSFLCGGYVKYGKKGCDSNHRVKMDNLKSYILENTNINVNSENLNSETINKHIEKIEICKEKNIHITYRNI